jgi:hypothetical protein|tara:strand:+ start:544 stop:813 length:270 start_codon:yes stop_codon:yes gene_type:complete
LANTDYSFDFGFSAMDEDELEAVQTGKAAVASANAGADDLEDRLNKLYNMVQPLLSNLKKNPEKDYIYWPNRNDKIEEFSDALDKVFKG